MFPPPSFHLEIARQRQAELLARSERDALARAVAAEKDDRDPAPQKPLRRRIFHLREARA